MTVVLLRDVPNIGRAGDVKNVAAGYARNFLIPRGLAVSATASAVQAASAKRQRAERDEKQTQEHRSEIAKGLQGQTIVIRARANEQGTLFASVGPSQVLEAIAKQLGFSVTADDLKMHSTMKTVGDHDIEATMTGGQRVAMTVRIEGEAKP